MTRKENEIRTSQKGAYTSYLSYHFCISVLKSIVEKHMFWIKKMIDRNSCIAFTCHHLSIHNATSHLTQCGQMVQLA